uniref:hypothetical protein n=1 Tax=Bradyrhizobium sp. SZCCHNR2032 TaxID=3057384 RepID=UPI0029166B1E
ASLLENASINRCSRYLNAYAAFPAPSIKRARTIAKTRTQMRRGAAKLRPDGTWMTRGTRRSDAGL